MVPLLFYLPPILILLSTLIYKCLLYPTLLSPLRSLPALHPTARFLPLPLILRLLGHGSAKELISRAHARHGPVIQLAPSLISINSPAALNTVYRSFPKTKFYSVFTNYGLPNLVAMIGAREHSEQKRMLAHVYSKSALAKNEDLRVVTKIMVRRWMALLEQCCTSEQIANSNANSADNGGVDFFRLNQALGADYMTAFLFGVQNGSRLLENAAERKVFAKDFRCKLKELWGHRVATRKLEEWMLGMCKGAEETMACGRDSKDEEEALLHDSNIDGRDTKEGEEKTWPVVYAQLFSRLSAHPSPFTTDTRRLAASEMFDHMLASQETGKVTLTWMQYELSLRPALQEELRQELLSLEYPLTLSENTDGDKNQENKANWTHSVPTVQEIESLPLLDAIFKETLRKYPPSPLLQPRLTPPDGCVIEGYEIPGGVTVGASAYCLHRNEEVFPCAGKWKPERWLDEKRRERERWWWGFSGGRMCIGNHFATYSLKIALAALYTNYRTEIVDARGIEPEDAILSGPVGERLVLRVLRVGE